MLKLMGALGMVEGKSSLSGRPTNFENSRVRLYCVCSRCGSGCLNIFFSLLPFLFLLLWEMDVD